MTRSLIHVIAVTAQTVIQAWSLFERTSKSRARVGNWSQDLLPSLHGDITRKLSTRSYLWTWRHSTTTARRHRASRPLPRWHSLPAASTISPGEAGKFDQLSRLASIFYGQANDRYANTQYRGPQPFMQLSRQVGLRLWRLLTRVLHRQSKTFPEF